MREKLGLKMEVRGEEEEIFTQSQTLNHQYLHHPQSDLSPSQSPPPRPPQAAVKYKECLKNHAASVGGTVLDGCGEFMPSGKENTPEALKCAACDCHRSFHRKEDNRLHVIAAPSMFYKNSQVLVKGQGGAVVAPPLMMAFGGAAAESSSEDLNNVGEVMRGVKKRFRTKFSQEQKDKMMEMAEKIGWRIHKEDEDHVKEFCEQVRVKRQVFKVWMHNNKQLVKKKDM